jgi:hypothetical protein
MRITSQGQDFTHSSQPMQASMLLIVMSLVPLRAWIQRLPMGVWRTSSALDRLVPDADQRVRHGLAGTPEYIVIDTLKRARVVDLAPVTGSPGAIAASRSIR